MFEFNVPILTDMSFNVETRNFMLNRRELSGKEIGLYMVAYIQEEICTYNQNIIFSM